MQSPEAFAGTVGAGDDARHLPPPLAGAGSSLPGAAVQAVRHDPQAMGSEDDTDDAGPAGQLTTAEAGGVRTVWVESETMQGLVDRLTVFLGEHMRGDDDLHVCYNAMSSGWTLHPAQPGGLRHGPQGEWTELAFEYSALVVLRQRGA